MLLWCSVKENITSIFFKGEETFFPNQEKNYFYKANILPETKEVLRSDKDISKEHSLERNQFEEAPTNEIWDNLSNKK